MSLTKRIQSDMVDAMRRKEVLRLATLRMVKTAITNKQVEKRAELSDEEVLGVIQTLVKQRRDSAEQFRRGGRAELAEKEESEIEVLQAYLPSAATEDQIHAVIGEVIAELGAAGPKDMGRVMKETLARLAGKTVDGGQVSQWVRKQLTG